MRKKIGFIKLIRLWGVVFLIALAGVIIGIDLVSTYHDFGIRMDNMRTEHVEQQKQMSKREVERVVNMINYERTQSEALAKKEIKSRAFEAYSIIQNIYEKNKPLKSDARIQKMIVDTLRPIRFNGAKGYYFIHSLSGENILDPTVHSVNGQNIINFQDSRGEYVVKKELDLLRKKEDGFLISYWPKPDKESTKDFKKMTFVKIFRPYNWTIGTGLYVDDIEERIKTTWMERINNIRYGKNSVGYLFAGSWRGISLAHGAQPNLIGTDILEYEDSRGNKTSQLLIAASKKKDGGYANFWWRKPDTGEERPKIAYAKGVPEWELLVATGVYMDDIENYIKPLQMALNAQIKTKVLISIIIVAIAFALFLFLFNLLSNRLRKDFNLFISFFDQAAFSNKKIDKEKLGIMEFILLSDSANHMVTERKQAEDQIKASLKEKETLLQEIHHRVKNNMQVISGLLKLQADRSEHIQIKQSLKESQNRVYAMSAVHETIYGSGNLAEINLREYVPKITNMLTQAYPIDSSLIGWKIESDDIRIGIEQASPLGLIINELISNSLIHAFPNGKSGRISVKIRKLEHNHVEVILMDNGIGLPLEFDLEVNSNLGLQLVKGLVENQLDGQIEVFENGGARFLIKFKLI